MTMVNGVFLTMNLQEDAEPTSIKRLLAQQKKNAEKLRPLLQSLLFDVNKRHAMAESARKLGRPEAARTVAEAIKGMVQSGR